MAEPSASPSDSETVDRRAFLKRLAVAAGGVVIESLPGRSRPRAGAAEEAFRLRALEPDPKRGGTLRYGVASSPAHFDIHQSARSPTSGRKGPMYDNLIRRDPATADDHSRPRHRWDIAPDGKGYTFHLRSGVKFHDGADFTAEDVKATFSRIIWPRRGS